MSVELLDGLEYTRPSGHPLIGLGLAVSIEYRVEVVAQRRESLQVPVHRRGVA